MNDPYDEPRVWVMRCLGRAAGIDTPAVGWFLKAYDPEAHDGRGHVEWTADPDDAMHFTVATDATDLWRAVPKCHPIRLTDGKPNRPLTSFTIEVITLGVARLEWR